MAQVQGLGKLYCPSILHLHYSLRELVTEVSLIDDKLKKLNANKGFEALKAAAKQWAKCLICVQVFLLFLEKGFLLKS